MKRLLIILVVPLLLSGCVSKDDYQKLSDEIDETNRYDSAIVRLPDGEIVEGEIEDWFDAPAGLIKIIFKNGEVYSTNSVNVTLIKEDE